METMPAPLEGEVREYPRYLYGRGTSYKIVADPDDHAAALASGDYFDSAEEAPRAPTVAELQVQLGKMKDEVESLKVELEAAKSKNRR